MEERLTAIIKELGEEEVVEFTSALGQEYVQYKSLEMIVERMYTS